MHEYRSRPLYLPGLTLEPGDLVIVMDSRGRVIKGIFLGYASKFIAIANNCGEAPYRFINIQRLNEIIVIQRGACVEGEGGKESRGNGDNSASDRETQHNS